MRTPAPSPLARLTPSARRGTRDTDFNFKQTVKLGESRALSFDATFTNVLNQHAVVAN